MDLDTILVNELGQIGQFQLRTLAVTCVLVIFRSWCANEYTFTTARIKTRCYIPGCDSASSEYSPEWVLSAVPAAGGGLDNCRRYANVTALPADGTCPANLFNTSHLIPCDSYVYENDHTVVYDFELACDDWRRSLIGSVRMMGMFAALPITGYISDRWGRRTALIFNAINAAWLGISRYWINNYILYLASVFTETALSGGVFTSAYVLAMEIMGPKYRVVGGACTNTFMAIGRIILAMVAMTVPYWRNFVLAIYAPQFLSIFAIFLMNESVRWSMNKGHYEEAEKVLKKIAKVNKKELSEKSLEKLRQTYEEDKNRQQHTTTKEFLADVIRNRSMLLRCLISPVCWIANIFVHHGLLINSTTISGNKYLNYVLVGLVEIPAYWIGIFLMNKVGRKPVLAGGFLICAAAQALYVFIPKVNDVVSISVYLIGSFFSGMMLMGVHIYTAELFPTRQRQRFLSYSSLMGRIGAVLAPLTPAFGAATFDELPFVLFGCSALLAGLLTLLLPETLDTKLPDTIHEAEHIGDNKIKPI